MKKNVRRFLRIKYPKLLLLALTFVAAYFIFRGQDKLVFLDALRSLGYIGTFLAGAFFSYGFTAAPATAILLILGSEQNIIAATLVGGLGALAGDLLIFLFIKVSFADEIKNLSKEHLVTFVGNVFPVCLKKYAILVFAGFIIASPLPDEIGVTLLAATRTVSFRTFSFLSYVLNSLGLFFILTLGNML